MWNVSVTQSCDWAYQFCDATNSELSVIIKAARKDYLGRRRSTKISLTEQEIMNSLPPAHFVSLVEFRSLVGKDLGISNWLVIDQDHINRFAAVTRDFQFIHVDPERAEKSPFGSTIAHGFLTLSMLPALKAEIVPEIVGSKGILNYGINNLRFISPVRSGRRIRAGFMLQSFAERTPGTYLSTLKVTVEIEGEVKPAISLEWLTLIYVE